MASGRQFPQLSKKPRPSDFAMTYDDDNAIKGKFEAGYEFARKRYPRIRRTFTMSYDALNAADYEAFTEFLEGKDASDSGVGVFLDFSWIHPVNGQTYQVRFVKSPQSKYVGVVDAGPAYDVSFQLREL